MTEALQVASTFRVIEGAFTRICRQERKAVVRIRVELNRRLAIAF